MSLRIYSADLHVHTCLSPCASLEMSPARIAERAKEVGLDIIAVCDHNSAENVEAVLKACMKTGIAVIPGVEITTCEEVHVLGLFEKVEQVLKVQENIYTNLDGLNREEFFGMQVVANEVDDVLDYNPLFLAGATTMDFERTVRLIHDNGGIAVASHVDREAFGLIGHLGFIPEDLEVDVYEITSRKKITEFTNCLTPRNERPVITNSDAHFLKDIGRERNKIMARDTDFVSIVEAITGEII